MSKKILFVAEASSWSQVVRLMVLARGLNPRKYEVHFASARSSTRPSRTAVRRKGRSGVRLEYDLGQ